MNNGRYLEARGQVDQLTEYLKKFDNVLLPLNYIQGTTATRNSGDYYRWDNREKGRTWAGRIKTENYDSDVVVIPALGEWRSTYMRRRTKSEKVKSREELFLIQRSREIYRVGEIRPSVPIMYALVTVGETNVLARMRRVSAGGYSYVTLRSMDDETISLTNVSSIARTLRRGDQDDANHARWIAAMEITNRVLAESRNKLNQRANRLMK